MERTHICSECGMANPLGRQHCQHCTHPLSLEPQSQGWPEPQPLLARDQPQEMPHTLHHVVERPQVQRIIRSSTRRKFLTGILGSAAILGLGSPALVQLFQNLQVSFSTRNFPYEQYHDLSSMGFSPNLNFMAMFKDRPADGLLYVWDYRQQRMTSFLAGPLVGLVAWSPDSRYVLCQTQYTDNSNVLDMWDIQARTRIRSYTDNSYTFHNDYNFNESSKIRWSPDGSLIALLLKDSFAILDAARLVPLSTFPVSPQGEIFAWSPDNRKLALLVGQYESSEWSIQIWDVQNRKMETEVSFQGAKEEFNSTLAWSPDGGHIAILSHSQLQIIQIISTLSSYALDEPNNFGRLAWSPDGRHLAVAVEFGSPPSSFGNDFSIWDVVNRNKVRVLNSGTLFTNTPNAITWSKDGSTITAISMLYQQENWYWL